MKMQDSRRQTSNGVKKFPKINPNIILGILLLLGIAFSVITIVNAVTPNPGHNFAEVSGNIVQGDLLYGSSTDVFAVLAKNTTATRYLSNTGASSNPAWAQVDMTNGITGDLPFANLTQGSALSVLGVTGNATADMASIAAASDFQVFRRSGTAVAFGSVNLASTNAVTGILPTANGGTGIAFFTAAGPTVARIFTFPDAAAKVLTDNADVLVSEGGTGLSASVSDAVLVGDTTSQYTARTLPASCAGTTAKLLYDSTTNLFSCGTDQTSAAGTPTQFNQSVTTPAAGFATDTYLVGSSIAIPANSLKVGTRYHLIFNVSKTAAGTATPIIYVRFGTAGSTADTARLTFTFLAGTAAADIGTFEVWVTFRTVGSGTSAVLQGIAQVRHRLQITGLQNLVSTTLQVTSAGFDSTVANSIIGASVNGGTSALWTISLVQAELSNLQ